MDEMIGTSTRHTGYAEGALPHDYTALQTTLYDLVQTLQDEVGAHEEHLVVDAVMQMLRHGRLRFLNQSPHSMLTCLDEVLPISA